MAGCNVVLAFYRLHHTFVINLSFVFRCAHAEPHISSHSLLSRERIRFSSCFLRLLHSSCGCVKRCRFGFSDRTEPKTINSTRKPNHIIISGLRDAISGIFVQNLHTHTHIETRRDFTQRFNFVARPYCVLPCSKFNSAGKSGCTQQRTEFICNLDIACKEKWRIISFLFLGIEFALSKQRRHDGVSCLWLCCSQTQTWEVIVAVDTRTSTSNYRS